MENAIGTNTHNVLMENAIGTNTNNVISNKYNYNGSPLLLLPTELLLYIYSVIDNPFDVLSFSSTCRTLRCVSQLRVPGDHRLSDTSLQIIEYILDVQSEKDVKIVRFILDTFALSLHDVVDFDFSLCEVIGENSDQEFFIYFCKRFCISEHADCEHNNICFGLLRGVIQRNDVFFIKELYRISSFSKMFILSTILELALGICTNRETIDWILDTFSFSYNDIHVTRDTFIVFSMFLCYACKVKDIEFIKLIFIKFPMSKLIGNSDNLEAYHGALSTCPISIVEFIFDSLPITAEEVYGNQQTYLKAVPIESLQYIKWLHVRYPIPLENIILSMCNAIRHEKFEIIEWIYETFAAFITHQHILCFIDEAVTHNKVFSLKWFKKWHPYLVSYIQFSSEWFVSFVRRINIEMLRYLYSELHVVIPIEKDRVIPILIDNGKIDILLFFLEKNLITKTDILLFQNRMFHPFQNRTFYPLKNILGNLVLLLPYVPELFVFTCHDEHCQHKYPCASYMHFFGSCLSSDEDLEFFCDTFSVTKADFLDNYSELKKLFRDVAQMKQMHERFSFTEKDIHAHNDVLFSEALDYDNIEGIVWLCTNFTYSKNIILDNQCSKLLLLTNEVPFSFLKWVVFYFSLTKEDVLNEPSFLGNLYEKSVRNFVYLKHLLRITVDEYHID